MTKKKPTSTKAKKKIEEVFLHGPDGENHKIGSVRVKDLLDILTPAEGFENPLPAPTNPRCEDCDNTEEPCMCSPRLNASQLDQLREEMLNETNDEFYADPCACCGRTGKCTCCGDDLVETDTLNAFYRDTGVVTWPQLRTIGLWVALSLFTLVCLGSLAYVITAR